MHLPLTNNYTLTVEPHLKNSVRLVVLSNGEEIACRKETVKNLSKFITSNEDQLFKGRVQLHRSQVGIAVQLKGEPIGIIPGEVLLQSFKITG